MMLLWNARVYDITNLNILHNVAQHRNVLIRISSVDQCICSKMLDHINFDWHAPRDIALRADGHVLGANSEPYFGSARTSVLFDGRRDPQSPMQNGGRSNFLTANPAQSARSKTVKGSEVDRSVASFHLPGWRRISQQPFLKVVSHNISQQRSCVSFRNYRWNDKSSGRS